jgi:hypothetical protein
MIVAPVCLMLGLRLMVEIGVLVSIILYIKIGISVIKCSEAMAEMYYYTIPATPNIVLFSILYRLH